MLVTVFNLLSVVWVLSEILFSLLLRAKRSSAELRDRKSLALLWIAIGIGLSIANVIRFSTSGMPEAPPPLILSVALIALVSGMALRWTAILTLRRFFTVNVAIRSGQHVVRSGVYRRIRHPAYSGLLLAFAGVGLAFDNAFSFLAVMIPVTGALLYRMRVEEKALLEALGREYADYCRVTRRLAPGVY